MQVYMILNDKLDVYPRDFLILNDRKGRNNSLKLYKQRVYKELSKHGFTFRIIEQWNSLSDQVVLAESVNEFKGGFDHLMRETGRRP